MCYVSLNGANIATGDEDCGIEHFLPFFLSGSEDKTALPYCDKLELMKEFLTRQVDKDKVKMKLGECPLSLIHI